VEECCNIPWREECKDVPRTVPNQECYQVPREECKQVLIQEGTQAKDDTDSLYETKCETRYEIRCQTIYEDKIVSRCETIDEWVCFEQEHCRSFAGEVQKHCQTIYEVMCEYGVISTSPTISTTISTLSTLSTIVNHEEDKGENTSKSSNCTKVGTYK
jgi:hypothetical protein